LPEVQLTVSTLVVTEDTQTGVEEIETATHIPATSSAGLKSTVHDVTPLPVVMKPCWAVASEAEAPEPQLPMLAVATSGVWHVFTPFTHLAVVPLPLPAHAVAWVQSGHQTDDPLRADGRLEYFEPLLSPVGSVAKVADERL